MRMMIVAVGVFGLFVSWSTLALGQDRAAAKATSNEQKEVASEQIFSGPQAGEPISAFSVRGVFDEWAGKEMDFVKSAAGKPIVLIFVHDLNRQSIAFTRILSNYTLGRSDEGLHTGIVWLSDDMTEAESTLKRIRHALSNQPQENPNRQIQPNSNQPSSSQPAEKSRDDKRAGEQQSSKSQASLSSIASKIPSVVGISPDGREGPGSYGLNRNVTLTILVAKDNKVIANFALVQPSLQVDMPKVLEGVVKAAGGKLPKLEELDGMPAMARGEAKPNGSEPPNLRPLIAPLIKLGATDQAVDQAAAAIEKQAAEDPATRKEVARIANTIINAGKLENYGTPHAQQYLQKWAREFK